MVPAGLVSSSVYIVARGVKWGVAVAGLYGIFHASAGCSAARLHDGRTASTAMPIVGEREART